MALTLFLTYPDVVKDLMIVFRHLMGGAHRRVLTVHLDKFFDEEVILGKGIGSKETLRYVLLVLRLLTTLNTL